MVDTVRAYIGLGSNLEAPREQVWRALEELAALPQTALVARSSLYRSDPMGPPDQPDYINAAAALDTALMPHALLDALLAIERAHGRVRGPTRWGPRTLDLDLLLYGERQISDGRLTVPHPGIAERAFVLYPLAELDAGLIVPGKGPIKHLLQACPQGGLERLAVDE
ncbi:MAG: 2-amino-4-hydroxy-6-hydroxymethyldihydropteridine diphosphokinase [Chromatiales bacterium]